MALPSKRRKDDYIIQVHDGKRYRAIDGFAVGGPSGRISVTWADGPVGIRWTDITDDEKNRRLAAVRQRYPDYKIRVRRIKRP